jgi:hypothetical protein
LSLRVKEDKLCAVNFATQRYLHPRGIRKRSADRATFFQYKTTRVDTFSPMVLHRVEAPGDKVLWRQLVNGYHYLGYRDPFGASVSYLIYNSDKRILIV